MKEYFELIGNVASYRVNGLAFDVELTDVKKSYGDIRFQIKPVAGVGTIWVSISSLLIYSKGEVR